MCSCNSFLYSDGHGDVGREVLGEEGEGVGQCGEAVLGGGVTCVHGGTDTYQF